MAGARWKSDLRPRVRDMPHDTTGVPVELLFAAVATLMGIVYADTKRELRRLRSSLDRVEKSALRRERMLDRLRIVLSLVCRKLNVPFASIIAADANDDETGEHSQL